MKPFGRFASRWQQYLSWRRGDAMPPPKLPDTPINKLAIDDSDVASVVTANRGSGFAR